MVRLWGTAVLAAMLAASPSAGAEEAQPIFVTLGTNLGPIPNASRAESANMLRYGESVLLIDAGDGVAWQLARAGLPLEEIDAVLISHLHLDHTGGLFAFLGQRYQAGRTETVTIYGPPGTKRMVDALVEAVGPFSDMMGGLVTFWVGPPADMVEVVEIRDGATFAISDIDITAAVNSHYSFEPGSEEAESFLSFSYRFDMPGRSIVYTGDTGPSEAVEKLAAGADLFVSEIMDPDIALAELKEKLSLPFFAWWPVEEHFRKEHLSPREVGQLATRAGVGKLVLTHNALPDADIPAARKTIADEFDGEIVFANDLDRF
ncbi:MAG: MBL fold metallo-hydrolase [Parvibaculum sp.]